MPMTMMNQNGRKKNVKISVSVIRLCIAPPTAISRFHRQFSFFCFSLVLNRTCMLTTIFHFFLHSHTTCVRKWYTDEKSFRKITNNTSCICFMCIEPFVSIECIFFCWNWIICECIEKGDQHSSCNRNKRKNNFKSRREFPFVFSWSL